MGGTRQAGDEMEQMKRPLVTKSTCERSVPLLHASELKIDYDTPFPMIIVSTHVNADVLEMKSIYCVRDTVNQLG